MKKLILVSLLGLSINVSAQHYKLVSTKGYRYDGAPNWLVIGDKSNIKTIINEVYHKLGTKKFSVEIVDNQQASIYAKMEFNMQHLSTQQDNYLDRHIVAMYDGLLETSTNTYELTFGSNGNTENYEPK